MKSQEETKQEELTEISPLQKAINYQKTKHTHVYSIEVNGAWCILRKPDRQTYSEAIGLVTPVMGSKPDFITAGLRVLQGCWLDGDKDKFFKDDEE
jgi:hypothetical protein